VIGGGLALSSTAIVLRLLSDRGELTGRVGRAAFAILVIQDLAVGFLLIVVASFGQDPESVAAAVGLSLLKAVAALAAILGIGRYLLRPLFWAVVGRRNTEVLTALTLLIVLGTGLLTHQAGLSMELGALLAGMLLAETTYRHQVAAEIEPFRGLLLGLFYMTVGMAIDLDLAVQHADVVVGLAAALMLIKAIIVMGLGRIVGMPLGRAAQLGVLLCQAGEFAFVLLGAGIAAGVVTEGRGQVLMVVVALTMMVTPLLATAGTVVGDRLKRAFPPAAPAPSDLPAPDGEQAAQGHVVIAGFGRVGAAVGRKLTETGVPIVAIDLDLGRIAAARASGFEVYFGDATRPEVLEAVHVEGARAIVITLDDPKATLQTVATLRYIFPELTIYARAYDDAHAAELRKAGAHIVVPELVATGLQLAGSILAGPDGRETP
jgi:Kef-type K+ transport system membrane component KefB